MTIDIDSQNFESYVPVYDAIPEKWEDGRAFIVEQLKKITNSLNTKEIGFYLDQELLSGKAFIPGLNIASDGGSSQIFRTVLRLVVDTGTLPNAGVKTVPHGITIDNNFTLISLYGAATDPTNLQSIGLGFPSVTPANSVEVFLNATDVVIITGVNRTSFTRSFIIIEYMQEL